MCIHASAFIFLCCVVLPKGGREFEILLKVDLKSFEKKRNPLYSLPLSFRPAWPYFRRAC
jgi:hypothetical protein